MPHFNPRSPCGERPFAPMFRAAMYYFNPRSPCGERRPLRSYLSAGYYFNPRSPCGERRPKTELSPIWTLFQSTLPVRGATGSRAWHWPPDNDFNPRSPCGERPAPCRFWWSGGYFNPRSPCGERRRKPEGLCWGYEISIHAPRAGSDSAPSSSLRCRLNFNPRSPCGERPITKPCSTKLLVFQSTLPVRGATLALSVLRAQFPLFQSTLPVRGATRSDPVLIILDLFQSTLPVRGATVRE